MNKGYIYKITNLINGKSYIGQTSKTVEQRFKRHISDSKRIKTQNIYLYKAFKKYGVENFKVETLCECNLCELNEKEIQYIKKYNTYNEGYNLTLGGEGFRTLDLDEKLIVSEYLKIKNISKISKIHNVSMDSISVILKKNKIKIISSENHAKEKGFKVLRIDINTDKVIEKYNTLHEAAKWVVENNYSKTKNINNAVVGIRDGIFFNKQRYGFLWKSDNYNEFEKINYIKNKKEIAKGNKEKNKKNCPICNLKMNQTASMCNSCFKKERKENSIIKTYIDKNTLKNLIRTKSFVEIGKIYNVTDSSIKKWCKSYNLPFRSSDIKEIKNEEWDEMCNLSDEKYYEIFLNKKTHKLSDEEIISEFKKNKKISYIIKKYHIDSTRISNILKQNGLADEIQTNEKRVRKIVQVKNGILIDTFDKITDAQNIYGKSICDCLSGKNKSAYGYQWFYFEDYQKMINENKNL